MRSIFCGIEKEHGAVLSSAQDFLLKREKPGVFVVGGTNLTGKTTLIKKIKQNGGLLQSFSLTNIDHPEKLWFNLITTFTDLNGRPGKATPEELYEASGLKKALKAGIRTFFLPEILANHTEALKLIRDELVERHHCKILFDIVSSNEGLGFFDSTANNRFIKKQLSTIFPADELVYHLLTFDRHVLQEGVVLISKYPDLYHDFETKMSIFPEDQRKLLVQANRENKLDSVLIRMLDLPLAKSIEKR